MSDVAAPQLQDAWPQAVVLVSALVGFVWSAAFVWRRRSRGEPLVAERPHPRVTWEAGDVALVVVGHLVVIEGPLVLETEQAVVAQRLLPLPVFVAQHAFLGAEGVVDHVVHDRLPLGLLAGLDFDVGEQCGHRSVSVQGGVRLSSRRWTPSMIPP